MASGVSASRTTHVPSSTVSHAAAPRRDVDTLVECGPTAYTTPTTAAQATTHGQPVGRFAAARTAASTRSTATSRCRPHRAVAGTGAGAHPEPSAVAETVGEAGRPGRAVMSVPRYGHAGATASIE